MARAVGSPSDGVDTSLVALQLRHWHGGIPNVQDDHLQGVHENRGHVAGILLVPPEAQQRRLGLGALVDDGGVLLVAEIKHANRSIGRDRCEDAHAAPGDVVHLLIVGDELRVHHARLDVPDGTRRVDAAGAQAPQVRLVPVERRERRAVVAVLAVVEHALELHLVLVDLPDAQIVPRRCHQVRLLALLVRDEHDLRCRVRVVERQLRVRVELPGVVIQLHNLHLEWPP